MFYFVIGQTKGGRYEMKFDEKGLQVFNREDLAKAVCDRLRRKGHKNVNVRTFPGKFDAECWIADHNLKGKEDGPK
jgi:hypothetical protein